MPGRAAVRMRVARRGASPAGPHECECDYATGNFHGLTCVVEKVALTYVGPQRCRAYAVAAPAPEPESDGDTYVDTLGLMLRMCSATPPRGGGVGLSREPWEDVL